MSDQVKISSIDALEAFRACFDKGLLIRVTGDIIAMSPPLIVETSHIDQMVDTIRSALSELVYPRNQNTSADMARPSA